jgi:hypothetical protein
MEFTEEEDEIIRKAISDYDKRIDGFWGTMIDELAGALNLDPEEIEAYIDTREWT